MTRQILFKKNKKQAQLQLQFNWIFILIVGVVILGFFFTIINNQNKKANVENAQDLIETLDSVFNTIYINPNTVNTFHITKVRVDFACEEGLSEYYIQGVGPIDTSKDIIFTPSTLRGNNIITWTKEWNVPFEAGVFTYMANDATAFVFVNISEHIWDLYQELPEEFEKTIFTDILNAQTGIPLITGYDRVVVILDGTINNHNDFQPFITLSNVGGSSGVYTREIDITNNKIRFDQQQTKVKPYYTEEMLWGAIFTDDEISYDCTVDKAVEKMTRVAYVLKERNEKLAEELTNSLCNDFLNWAITDLEDLIQGAKNWKYPDYWEPVQEAREDLEDDQAVLLRGYRCPNIY